MLIFLLAYMTCWYFDISTSWYFDLLIDVLTCWYFDMLIFWYAIICALLASLNLSISEYWLLRILATRNSNIGYSEYWLLGTRNIGYLEQVILATRNIGCSKYWLLRILTTFGCRCFMHLGIFFCDKLVISVITYLLNCLGSSTGQI